MQNLFAPDASARQRLRAFASPTRLSSVAMVLLLGVSLCAALGAGAVPLTVGQSISAVLRHLGANVAASVSPEQAGLLWALRLPRVLLAAGVGAALAAVGVAMQGLFRSPLADPALTGASSGAALAAMAVGTGLGSALGTLGSVLAATLGALGSMALVYRLCALRGTAMMSTMVLAGVAVNAAAGAAMGLGVFVGHPGQMGDWLFWSLGSTGHASWQMLGVAAPFLLAPTVGLPGLARGLNAVLLGEAEARHLGFDTRRLRWVAALLMACGIGAAVATCGIVAFLGLLAPHLARQLMGSDHRLLLPSAACLGATLLVWADVLARSLCVPAEIPVGLFLALLGAPLFLWALVGERARLGSL